MPANYDAVYRMALSSLSGHRVTRHVRVDELEIVEFRDPSTRVRSAKFVFDHAASTVVMTGDVGRAGLYFNSGNADLSEFRFSHGRHISWQYLHEKADLFLPGQDRATLSWMAALLFCAAQQTGAEGVGEP